MDSRPRKQLLRIEDLRRRHGLTQLELAFLSECNVADISRYENGHIQPRRQTLLRLCVALGLTEDDAPTLLSPVDCCARGRA
jgi:transcriptional regulator with XRE-family HTH domain